MTEETKDKNLEEKIEDKNINKVTLDINEDKKFPWIPPWMSAEYHKLRGLPPFVFVESALFSFTMPYLIPSSVRRMKEWHWDKDTPILRTIAMGLGTSLGTTLTVIPPLFAGINAYKSENLEYVLPYFLAGFVTNVGSYLYEAIRKKPVIEYRDPFDDKPSNIGK